MDCVKYCEIKVSWNHLCQRELLDYFSQSFSLEIAYYLQLPCFVLSYLLKGISFT